MDWKAETKVSPGESPEYYILATNERGDAYRTKWSVQASAACPPERCQAMAQEHLERVVDALAHGANPVTSDLWTPAPRSSPPEAGQAA